MNANKRVIAIYLPQFHPFKENDDWWGKGFTEWTNVTKARPKFKGHYQPHLPTDLGFYDLRVPEVREEQAQLAKDAGIYGFCYYHYWFNGKPLMERPLKEVLDSGKPDFPFMICWANENWTRAWDGGEKEILIAQDYTDEDAMKHIKWLIPYLKDPRYIKIDGKPVISIYRTTKIPNLESMIKIWREECRKEGIELYITRFESFGESGAEYNNSALDAVVEFGPHTRHLYKSMEKNIWHRIIDKSRRLLSTRDNPQFADYKCLVKTSIENLNPDYKCFPCVVPSWDNTSRRKKNMFILLGSSPERFENWLSIVLEKSKSYSEDENLVFINAWNEWAEGNHLEPDIKWGRKYLEACRNAIFNNKQS